MVRLRVWLLIMMISCASWAVPVNTALGDAGVGEVDGGGVDRGEVDGGGVDGGGVDGGERTGRTDFNGDGFADLAVGAVESVHVLYGSRAGLIAAGNQLWSQDSSGIKGSTGADLFGRSLAVGDFNGDGFGDLAVGVPGEEEGVMSAGAVNVIYGSADGLTSAGNQLLSQDSPGVVGTAEVDDAFGWSLAAANFGNSAHDDLLVGVPFEDVGGAAEAGAVQVLYGSTDGLTSAGNSLWTQDSSAITSRAERGDLFGWSVAVGDFGLGRESDVAVGSQGEDLDQLSDTGVVHVLFGSAAGLTSSEAQMWSQDRRGVPGAADENDFFGSTLTAANFGKNDKADIAVGVPGESTSNEDGSGAVTLLYGSDSGPTSAGSQSWSQDSTGIKGAAEAGDFFGVSLAAADLGRSRHADLVVGIPHESVGNVLSGAVNVIYGSDKGLTPAGDQSWSPGSPGIKGDLSRDALFGSPLAAGNFGKGGRADVTIGVPEVAIRGESLGAGVAHVIYGSADGLAPDGDQLWSRGTPGIVGRAGPGVGFGRSLVVAP